MGAAWTSRVRAYWLTWGLLHCVARFRICDCWDLRSRIEEGNALKILSLINLEILYFLFVCDESFITQEEQNDSALNREGPARAMCSHPWKRTIQCLRLRLLYYSVSVYPRQRTWQFYQTRLMKVVPIFTERPSTVIASQKDEYLLIFSDFNSTPRSS